MMVKCCDQCHGLIETKCPNEEDYYVVELTHMAKVRGVVQSKNYSKLDLCMDCMSKMVYVTILPEKSPFKCSEKSDG